MNLLQQSWYQKGHWLSIVLLPLAALYWLLSSTRTALFRLGIKRQFKLAVPVVIVGNISVGGTGKTPFTLWLCQQLLAKGLRPGIISRGYGAKVNRPIVVTADSLATEVGDEPLLLARRSGCPVVVCPDRVAAGRELLGRYQVDIIICDDGLQHYRLARDFEIVLVDGRRGFGNGLLLPAGPLRERRDRLANVDLIIANSGEITQADYQMQLSSSVAKSLLTGTELAPCSVTLVAGIGNPQRFQLTAQQAGFKVVNQRFFADHHHFTAADFNEISGPVLMTEKDAVKCQHFGRDNWYFLPVDASFTSEESTEIINKITQLLE
ncbi:lipid-A-disaccharide kinase [Arsukibacterium tuosuense]|uniref:Tetraacyldisaccharide 4'-kinase n=1 Tax=Arsukibacterium tuosuense TaxID=1323745 RepID=A0A285I6Q5_9GAMM|nr:tetraacyldisaccharide 4'-kinase [Arsukibacterium tuosuense]SNY43614.1 lipid-A-disaccharide kinase [Arsukibacterium tuosuense]